MYTELCLEWPNKMTDKLPRESHVKQLLVDSMLCFSFDRPVTDNCPILVLKKNVQDWKKYYQRLQAVPTWFQQRWKWFKSILILMSTKKRHIRSAWTPIVCNMSVWCFGCLSGPPGFTCWISFAPVFSLIYCWVLILALSPCYILIYMF